ETGGQLGRGEISGKQAAGKTADAALHAVLQAVPFVGPAIETAGTDIAQGNYRGAAGGLTGVIGQIAAPELIKRGGAAIRGVPGEVPARIAPVAPEPSLPGTAPAENGVGQRIVRSSAQQSAVEPRANPEAVTAPTVDSAAPQASLRRVVDFPADQVQEPAATAAEEPGSANSGAQGRVGIGDRIVESAKAGVPDAQAETVRPGMEPDLAGAAQKAAPASIMESGAEELPEDSVKAGETSAPRGQAVPAGEVPNIGDKAWNSEAAPVVGDATADANPVEGATAGQGGKTELPIEQYRVFADKKIKLPEGIQANHLNQNAAYGTVIPARDGLAVPMKGDVFADKNSPHYRFHRVLEDFWDQFRDDGPRKDDMPTNAEYDAALRRALEAAGLDPEMVTRAADQARQQRLDFGLKDEAEVPRLPERFMSSSNRPPGTGVKPKIASGAGPRSRAQGRIIRPRGARKDK
ncbi:MAG: hypothetical protein LAP21_16650, partial [Acidobacteriia bacterium]|nr:hypothetical protein [Terriglobia bacterium]